MQTKKGDLAQKHLLLLFQINKPMFSWCYLDLQQQTEVKFFSENDKVNFFSLFTAFKFSL